jgi:hypothetical protein
MLYAFTQAKAIQRLIVQLCSELWGSLIEHDIISP